MADDPGADPGAEPRADALDALLELTVALSEDMDGALARLGLGRSRAHVLHLLSAEGPQPQHALARALGITPRAVTGLVDALVAGGLVARAPHPGDRRATLVTPTQEGARLAEGLVEGRLRLAEELFAGLDGGEVARDAASWRRTTRRLRELGAEERGPGGS